MLYICTSSFAEIDFATDIENKYRIHKMNVVGNDRLEDYHSLMCVVISLIKKRIIFIENKRRVPCYRKRDIKCNLCSCKQDNCKKNSQDICFLVKPLD